MQRRVGLEDARQQIVGHRRVERNAALDVVAQPDLPLDDDDRPDPACGQCRRRHHQLLDGLIVTRRALEILEELRASEMCQGATDVGLKENDDRKHHVGGEIANHPIDGLEVEPLRDEEQRDQKAAAQRHLHRARTANQQQQLVDQDRDERHVEQIPPRDGGPAANQLGKPIHHSDVAMILPDFVGDAYDFSEFLDGMYADDVGAAQDSRRHRGTGRPIARSGVAIAASQRLGQE